MKCCYCDKKIDIDKHEIPPTWYGIYYIDALIDITCPECLKENREDWRNRSKDIQKNRK